MPFLVLSLSASYHFREEAHRENEVQEQNRTDQQTNMFKFDLSYVFLTEENTFDEAHVLILHLTASSVVLLDLLPFMFFIIFYENGSSDHTSHSTIT